MKTLIDILNLFFLAIKTVFYFFVFLFYYLRNKISWKIKSIFKDLYD